MDKSFTTIPDLYEIAARLKVPLLGVYPKNKIPNVRSAHNGIIIFNMQDAGGPGTHWIALYLEDGKRIYFDSYGQVPPLEVEQLLREGDMRSNREIQSLYSGYCGQYNLYFAWFMINNRRCEPNILKRLVSFEKLWSEKPSLNLRRLKHFLGIR